MDDSLRNAPRALGVLIVRHDAKSVLVVILATMAGMCLIAPNYLKPFVSVTGLAVLMAVGLVLGGAWRLWQRAAIAAEWRFVEGLPPLGPPKMPLAVAMIGAVVFMAFPGLTVLLHG